MNFPVFYHMPRVAYLKITIMHEPWLCCVFRRPSCMHMVYSWQGQLCQKKIVWGPKLEKVGRGGYGILRNCNFRERKIYHIPYECISFKTCKSPISHLIFMYNSLFSLQLMDLLELLKCGDPKEEIRSVLY